MQFCNLQIFANPKIDVHKIEQIKTQNIYAFIRRLFESGCVHYPLISVQPEINLLLLKLKNMRYFIGMLIRFLQEKSTLRTWIEICEFTVNSISTNIHY